MGRGLAAETEKKEAGKNLFQARRELQQSLAQSPKAVTYSALIALERMAGNEAVALAYWEKCGEICKSGLGKKEFQVLQKWACSLNRVYCGKK